MDGGRAVGYARCSTDEQDLTVQREALGRLGVPPERVYVDHGRTWTNRDRPGLRQALAAVRAGDTLVVTKLDRLARSVPDARNLVDELTAGGVRLSIGGSVHDPADPVNRLLFDVLSMVAKFEADLIRARTREGMAIATAKGRLRGGVPKLSPAQHRHLVELHTAGAHTGAELAELFGVARSSVYRAIDRSTRGTGGTSIKLLGTNLRDTDEMLQQCHRSEHQLEGSPPTVPKRFRGRGTSKTVSDTTTTATL